MHGYIIHTKFLPYLCFQTLKLNLNKEIFGAAAFIFPRAGLAGRASLELVTSSLEEDISWAFSWKIHRVLFVFVLQGRGRREKIFNIEGPSW